MANFDTSIRAAQVARRKTRGDSPSFRPLQAGLRYAAFDYTVPASGFTTGSTISLGALGLAGARVIPELSRVVDTGGDGDLHFDATLRKVDAAGANAVALSGTVKVDNASVALTRLASGATPELGAEDCLQLLVAWAGEEAFTPGETLRVEVAYVAPNCV